MTAISHRHALIKGNLVSLDTTLRRWIKGLEHTKSIPRLIMSTWCLELILATLTRALFEPIETCPIKFQTWKTAFLTITSTCKVSEMHALCYKPPYICFSNVSVMLFVKLCSLLNWGFSLRSSRKPIRPGPSLCHLCTIKTDVVLCNLCVRQALNVYLHRTTNVKAQLFVAYGIQDKGNPISKQRLSKWLVKCIKYTYDKKDLPIPEGVKGHQTPKMAVTYANMVGPDPQTICEAACWANTCMFARFYRLDAVANSDVEFGRRVLMLAGSSTPAPHR